VRPLRRANKMRHAAHRNAVHLRRLPHEDMLSTSGCRSDFLLPPIVEGGGQCGCAAHHADAAVLWAARVDAGKCSYQIVAGAIVNVVVAEDMRDWSGFASQSRERICPGLLPEAGLSAVKNRTDPPFEAGRFFCGTPGRGATGDLLLRWLMRGERRPDPPSLTAAGPTGGAGASCPAHSHGSTACPFAPPAG
jgi:hypothetical protein